jgi:sterol desaturase/sphingolipid hydroxylase (fatty acid hydroxylase superfamily)
MGIQYCQINNSDINNNSILRKLLIYERNRYSSHGYLRLIGLLLFFLYFYYFPSFVMMVTVNAEEYSHPGLIISLYIIAFHDGIVLIWNVMYYKIYHMKSKFFDQFKITETPFEWETDKEKWGETYKKIVWNQMIIHTIFLPLIAIPHVILNKSPHRVDIESFPTFMETLSQFFFCYIVSEITFAATHRLSHSKYLYKHHKVHHEFKESFALTTEYLDPIDYIFGTALPYAVAPALLEQRMHWASYITYMSLLIARSIDVHSGYDLPWNPLSSIPFLSNDPKFHAYHHLYTNGNYGFSHIWDLLFGTVVKPFEKKYFTEELEEKKKI